MLELLHFSPIFALFFFGSRFGSGLVWFRFGPVLVWSGSADVAGQECAWRALACASRVLVCVWHVLACAEHVLARVVRGRSCRNCHRRVAARGGSGETILHAVLQIGGRGTLWWCPLLDSMLGGAGF